MPPQERALANVVNIEDYAMTVQGLRGQVNLIQDVMASVLKEDEHYGTIPGTKKPTLYKPGAEKLCLTFRLDPDYEIVREVREPDFIAYTIKCILTHIPSNVTIASGIGSCNSRETKYRWRYEEKSTDVPVPKAYWDARKSGDSKAMKRILNMAGNKSNNEGNGNFRAAKIDDKWVVAKAEKVENDNPWDLDNTIIKMACKRALIAATLNATAASDIFTQDVEDMDIGTVQKETTHKTDGVPSSSENGKEQTATYFDQHFNGLKNTFEGKLRNHIQSGRIKQATADDIEKLRAKWNDNKSTKGKPFPLDDQEGQQGGVTENNGDSDLAIKVTCPENSPQPGDTVSLSYCRKLCHWPEKEQCVSLKQATGAEG